MPEMSKGFTLFKEHMNAPFPDQCSGVNIKGIWLVMLDADTAGCIDSYYRKDGTANRLDSARQEILAKCRAELSIVTKELEGYASLYFQRLQQLADIVLSDVQKQ